MNNGEYLISIGKKIREIRKKKGISQRMLFKMGIVHRSSISEIENGKMNIKILALKKLADVLEVDVKDFL